jgi:hypothetical protein
MVATIGQKRREIALATHLNSPIANETCSHEVAHSPARRAAEVKLEKLYPPRRPPTAGYNCFGHAFALRRTAIFDDDGTDIDRILVEDGFAPVSDNDAAPGDVVLYSDERHRQADRARSRSTRTQARFMSWSSHVIASRRSCRRTGYRRWWLAARVN